MGKQSSSLKKVFIAVIVLLFGAGCGVNAAVSNQNSSDEHENQFTMSGDADDPLLNQTLALYYDAGRIFLKKDLKQPEIDIVSEALSDSNAPKEVTAALEDVQQRFDAVTAVNNLFVLINNKSPLNGPILQHYVLLNENITQENIDKIKAGYQNQLPDPKAATDAADGFYMTLAFLIAEAENQLSQLQQFHKHIANLKENQELTYEELIQILDNYRKEVATLANPYVKARLIKIIGETDREMTKRIGQKQLNEARHAGADEKELSAIEAAASEHERIAEERYESDLQESSDFLEAAEINGGADLSQGASNAGYDYPNIEHNAKTPRYEDSFDKGPVNGAESEKPAKEQVPVQSETPSGSEQPQVPAESAKPGQPINGGQEQPDAEKKPELDSEPKPEESSEPEESAESKSTGPELPDNNEAGSTLVNHSSDQLIV